MRSRNGATPPPIKLALMPRHPHPGPRSVPDGAGTRAHTYTRACVA